MTREAVFRQIDAERQRQAAAHPADESDLELFLGLSILGEEVGEVHRAALEVRASLLAGRETVFAEDSLRTELLQVAAVAVKLIEALDADSLHVARTEEGESQPEAHA